MIAAALYLLLAATGRDDVREAERLASAAGERPAAPAALDDARRALALTAEFDPVAFVRAGRKGEVVEDSFLEAREAYRRHRARLYEAVGACLAERDRTTEAARYLGRAHDLDPAATADRFVRAWTRLGRGEEALGRVLSRGELTPDTRSAASEAADALGLASLQVEIDRSRLLRLEPRPDIQDGPVDLGDRLRLSTGAPFSLDAAPTVIYIADGACRSCSADLDTLRRLVPASYRMVLAPAEPDQDAALRRAVSLYRYTWPILLGARPGAFAGKAPRVRVVARNGFLAVGVVPPFITGLPPVLELLGRTDIGETVPRSSWNGRRVARGAEAPAAEPELGALMPGEDLPPPEEFTAAMAAYREKRYAEALRLIETLERRGDGWLLPPEARLDRALCLVGLGRRDAARQILLRIGDSRHQEHVDRVLEAEGSPRRRR